MKLDLFRFLQKQLRRYKFTDTREQFILPNDPIQKKGELISKEVFTGGPESKFSVIGRLYLITLLKIGINPNSKVLDVGCGSLRGGYWLIHFLNPNKYFGIEPNIKMLDSGKKILLDKETLSNKAPKFDYNETFDFSVFNETFDFIVARSIWTHASKSQIEKMLDEFIKNSRPNGIFLTSYQKPYYTKDDYSGSSWIGKSNKSDESGMVFHRLSWIEEVCNKRNLKVKELQIEVIDQIWLYISKL